MLNPASTILQPIFRSRLWALIVKETREILRNRYLVFLILVPPVVQLLILGGALDPQVRNLSLGAVDHAQQKESRELLAQLGAAGVFGKCSLYSDENKLSEQLERGKLQVGLVIPPHFDEDLSEGKSAQVQVLVDGADAYTAGIASGYILRTIKQFLPEGVTVKTINSGEARSHELRYPKTASQTVQPVTHKSLDQIDPRIQILYNPEQISSWCFIPGILGACLTLTGTLVASATVLRERESGTMEQLLMTPASSWEILLAKIIPLVVFLLGDVCLATFAAKVIFGMPVRGSMLLLLFASALYAFVGIGMGMMLGSMCRSQRQAQLASFFINIPLILLSGSVVPLETMPALLQAISAFDPLRYYTLITRSVILKGGTFAMLWQPLALLAVSAVVVLSISANRFRRQLI